MTEEQRAVVLARTQGDLKFDTMSTSMRSCFPDYVTAKRRTIGAHVVEPRAAMDEPAESFQPEPEIEFEDVELFLAEHGGQETSAEPEDTYEEHEIADILAVSWKEKRQELNKLKQSRQFHKEADLKKTYRIEVEELKKRTRCHRCKKVGHWARECRTKPANSKASSSSTHAAGCVQVPATEHFVCAAGWMSKGMTLLERVRAKLRSSDEKVKDETNPFRISLVSSPGYPVLDSGCGKTIIGAATLESFRKIWNVAGINQPEPYAEENVFRFGNGSSEVSKTAIELPVCLAERQGVIRAAIVKGDAPLLLSRPAMKTLAAEMDFAKDELRLFGGNTAVSMQVNTAGQYMIPVTEFPVQQPLSKIVEEPATTVLTIESDDPEPASELSPPEGECTAASVTSDAVPVPREGVVMSHNGDVTIVGKRGKTKDYWVIKPAAREVIRVHIKPRAERFTPCHAHCPVLPEELSSVRITRWNIVGRSEPTCELQDQWADPAHAHDHLPLPDGSYWVGETVFQLAPDAAMPAGTDHETLMTQWTPKQSRQLAQQVGKLEQSRKTKKPFCYRSVFTT